MASLFVPLPEREALLAVYALSLELGRIPNLVSEEMIGHIRLAWWQEAVDELYMGHAPRGQPVLQALAAVIASEKLPRETLMPLMDAYRESYPDLPAQLQAVFEPIHLALLTQQGQAGWHKADAIIRKHRQRYGKGWNGWLIGKLLLAGR